MQLEVADSATFVLHDFRRGHARDLQLDGANLRAILEAGQWRSCAFLKYLDVEGLERDAIVEAHVCESSDED